MLKMRLKFLIAISIIVTLQSTLLQASFKEEMLPMGGKTQHSISGYNTQLVWQPYKVAGGRAVHMTVDIHFDKNPGPKPKFGQFRLQYFPPNTPTSYGRMDVGILRIVRIDVVKPFRGRGIGTEAMETLLRVLRTQAPSELKEIWLECNNTESRLYRWYQSFGFEKHPTLAPIFPDVDYMYVQNAETKFPLHEKKKLMA